MMMTTMMMITCIFAQGVNCTQLQLRVKSKVQNLYLCQDVLHNGKHNHRYPLSTMIHYDPLSTVINNDPTTNQYKMHSL